MHGKLAAVGLVPARESSQLKPWLDKYMAGRPDLKPESRRKLLQTVNRLVKHFGEKTSLRTITASQASEWRSAMVGTMAEASLKIHAGNAKGLFAEAERQKLVAENSFLHLPSGATPASHQRYVTPDESRKILAACPTWQLPHRFSRHPVRRPAHPAAEAFGPNGRDAWDWDRSRLLVRSPKTERFAGHEMRHVPITPELLPVLQEALENAEERAEKVISLKPTRAIDRNLIASVEAAGVKPWKALFQTLRSSCEIEWAMRLSRNSL